MATILALAAMTTTAAAQQPHYGFKVGPTFATLDFTDNEEFGTRTAVGGGVFVVLGQSRPVALQLEGLYRPGGAKASTDIDDETSASLKYMFNYFEVPVLARVMVSRSASRAFYVFAGGAPAFRTSAKLESSASGGGFSSGTVDDVDNVKRFDFSAVAGAGIDIGRHIVIDGRYTWGFVDVDDTPDSTVKNRSLTFLVGYRF